MVQWSPPCNWPSSSHATGTEIDLLDAGPDLLAFTRGPLTVVLNAGTESTELPAGDVVLASGELDGRQLPPDTAVWLVQSLGRSSAEL